MFTLTLLSFGSISFVAWMMLLDGFRQRRNVRRRKEIERARTTGRIEDYVRGYSRVGRAGHSYRKPVVEYQADGQLHRAEYKNQMDRKRYPVGTEVEILCDADNPPHFHLENDPVFVDPGTAAIRVAIVWILVSAALSIFFHFFVPMG